VAAAGSTAESTLEAAAASGLFNYAWLLIAIPLVSATILLVMGRRADRWGHVLGTLAPLASFALGVALFLEMSSLPEDGREIIDVLYGWMFVGSFDVELSLLLDPLSMVFVLLITGVGSLIHIYSIGYMSHDSGRRRFFGYLNLFVAAMLLLVLAANYLVLYVGWEGVGLASYLLIGFWFTRPEAATAAKKAFIVNRVGDVGLALAVMLMFWQLGTTSFEGVFGAVGLMTGGAVTVLGLLLLLGAAGKSGQFPLHVWLPDAMEGPTPVSALIHAATMVTAGVYLIARSAPIYNLSSQAQTVVIAVGAITLLLGAIIGTSYDDIKKVLAYSTVSQIGYMFLAVGLGTAGYIYGIFLLLMHGFFKAVLFLGAGSVMHGMNDQTDIRRFGGLRKAMPVTFLTFMAGYLAIIGFPGLSGFFAKDKVIEAAFDHPDTGWLLGSIAVLGAALTAFYMTRLVIMTFFGEKRWTEDVTPHESPSVMTWPMVVLAALSVVGGALLLSPWLHPLETWLEPVLGFEEPETPLLAAWQVTLITLVAVGIGVTMAVVFVGRRPVPLSRPVPVSPLVRAARNDLYFNSLYEATLMRPGQYLTRLLVFLENKGIDGAVNGTAAAVGGLSGRMRRWQTGYVRSYALTMMGGAVVFLIAVVAVSIG
jgi:NADH-quinone oxidoreductase subunit L